MLLTQGIITGIVTSILCTAMILASLAHNSRMWISDMPKEMQKSMTRLSPHEVRSKWLWGIPIMLGMFGYPIYMAIQYEIQHASLSFNQAFGFFFVVWLVWNMWDLLIVDWFVVVWWHPSAFDLPAEVTHLRHLNNYWFHFTQFLKGCVLITILSTIMGAVFSVF